MMASGATRECVGGHVGYVGAGRSPGLESGWPEAANGSPILKL
jgi:hypothetical protein